MAAVHINGVTIHSRLSIMPFDQPFKPLPRVTLDRITKEFEKTRVLVIDEISLVTAILLAQIDHRMREIKASDQPFGGLSVIIVGDLLQLPPVSQDGTGRRIFSSPDARYDALRRSFSTPDQPLWKLFDLIELKQNMRVRCRRIAKMLESIRLGEEDPKIMGFLHRQCRMEGSSPADVFAEYTRVQNEDPAKNIMVLAPTNEQVNQLNRWKIDQTSNAVYLEGQEERPGDLTTPFFRRGGSMRIKVAVGLKVMVTENIDHRRGVVNGLLGRLVVIGNQNLIIERLDNKEKVALGRQGYQDGSRKFYQFPIQLAEAITIHKSQGMTYDGVIIVSEKLFGVGAFYTALSRSRNVELTRITSVENVRWRACHLSIMEMEAMRRRSK